jgi:hypothetical protein
LSDLQSFVAEQQKATPPAQAADGKQIEGAATPNATPNTPPSSEDAPSWRFWM